MVVLALMCFLTSPLFLGLLLNTIKHNVAPDNYKSCAVLCPIRNNKIDKKSDLQIANQVAVHYTVACSFVKSLFLS
jgi:hypothetical protein